MEKLQVTSYELQVTEYRKPHTANRIPLAVLCILLLAFCFLHQSSFAQKKHSKKSNPYDLKHLYGVCFGPTIDWFAPTSDGLKRNAAKVGFIGGVNIDINLPPKKFLYLSTGVLVRYLQGETSFYNKYLFHLLSSDSLERATVRNYQTYYLTIPTGLKFRVPVADRFVFTGKLGLYHNFRLGGSQYDNFELENNNLSPEYFVTTFKTPNKDASLFAESGYVGLGVEYLFGNNTRVYANFDYGCQFNYFNAKAKSNMSDAQFKSIVHSLNIVFGILF
jgi:hypothetical protein